MEDDQRLGDVFSAYVCPDMNVRCQVRGTFCVACYWIIIGTIRRKGVVHRRKANLSRQRKDP